MGLLSLSKPEQECEGLRAGGEVGQSACGPGILAAPLRVVCLINCAYMWPCLVLVKQGFIM